jgi:hypothetical protein
MEHDRALPVAAVAAGKKKKQKKNKKPWAQSGPQAGGLPRLSRIKHLQRSQDVVQLGNAERG